MRHLVAVVVVVVAIVTATATAGAQSTDGTGFFFCSQLAAGACTQWQSATDGVASLEQLGITPDAILDAFAWGFGAVVSFFALGLGFGAAFRVVKLLAE